MRAMIDRVFDNLLKALREACAFALLAAALVLPASAQDASEPGPMPVPLFWRIDKPDPAPDLSVVETLRIITELITEQATPGVLFQQCVASFFDFLGVKKFSDLKVFTSSEVWSSLTMMGSSRHSDGQPGNASTPGSGWSRRLCPQQRSQRRMSGWSFSVIAAIN